MPQLAAIGEVMIELSPTPVAEHKALSYAGDTYNTVITLARLGIHTSYCTRLGDDAYSLQIMKQLGTEGVATDIIAQADGEVPGLYMINNTPDGEREFLYWRNTAPAKQLFALDNEREAISAKLMQHEWIYFSGITLAIMSATARAHLIATLRDFRSKGGKVAFDSNYRPRLWLNSEEAQKAMMLAMSQCDLALLTLDDEELLWGDTDLDATRHRYSAFNISELVFKRGADDVIIYQGEQETRIAVKPVTDIIDTTAAGDTFNAGYLAARIQGLPATEAAQQACQCAGIIIQHRGGVIDRDVFLAELGK